MITKIKRYLKRVNPLDFKDNEKILTIKKIGSGESNLNFLIQTNKKKYLMRFDIDLKTKLNQFTQEYTLLKKLEPINIAQKPLFIDASKKYFKERFIIISYIEGKSLDKLNEKKYSSYYPKLAKKLANLHRLKLTFVNSANSFDKNMLRTEKVIRDLKKDLNGFEEKDALLKLFEVYHKVLRKKLKIYKPRLTFCHGDVCLPNVLLHKKEFFLIDWELSGSLDPALELSYHFNEFSYSEQQKKKFLKEYLKIREDKTLAKRMEFGNFFMTFSEYFNVLRACFKVAKKRGHKDYLKNADFIEYWKWGGYYLSLVCKLNLLDKSFEKVLRKELREICLKLK